MRFTITQHETRMSTNFDTPADAEDAYYDAIDESDLEKMMSVWDDSPHIACLLPMQALRQGRETVRELWQGLLEPGRHLDITVNHLQWIEQGDMAIHLLEEVVTPAGSAQHQPPIYATNVFRRSEDGWRLLLHVNSPAPPPPGMMPPGFPG
jgi:ketosteroid isomerase-like protein